MEDQTRIVDAALRLASSASVSDILGVLTPEAIHLEVMGDGKPNAPGQRAISKLFAGGPESGFDRRILGVAMLERATELVTTIAVGNVEAYEQAADTIRRGGGPEAIVSAIAADLRDYLPGGEATDVDARERAYYLFVALADDDRQLAKVLRSAHVESQRLYWPVYETFLRLLNRRLADGVAPDQLYLSISGYLEAVSLYRRIGLTVSDELIADTVIRHCWAHTTPINSHAPSRNPLDELWEGINPPVPAARLPSQRSH